MTTNIRQLRNCWLALTALLAINQDSLGEKIVAPEKQPDRREMWVPYEHLARVLEKKAVLLTREQYEVLLRDAGLESSATEAPKAAMISSTSYRARVEGDAVTVEAAITANVLREGWIMLPLDFYGVSLGEVKFDREGALIPASTNIISHPVAKRTAAPAPEEIQDPSMLLLRGRGLHQVTIGFTIPITNTDGSNGIACELPSTAAGSFILNLPADVKVETDGQAGKVETTAAGTIATFALSPAQNLVEVSWTTAAANASAAKFTGNTKLDYTLDAESVTGAFAFHLSSISGGLPTTLEFTLPAGVKVLGVQAPEISSWQADAGKITVQLQPGDHKTLDITLTADAPTLAQEAGREITLPVPELSGLQRMQGTMSIRADKNVTVKRIALDSSIQRISDNTDDEHDGFSSRYQFTARPAPRITLDRVVAHMETDLDTLVSFQQEAIWVERTITLRDNKGLRFSTAIRLPENEEFLSLQRADGIEPDWRKEAGSLRLSWSDRSTQPRIFKIRSRITLENWATIPVEGVSFSPQDAKIDGAEKLTGYIALSADPSFRMEVMPGEMLERRDGRHTPVRGEYVWFRRNSFDLKVKINRKPAEVIATLTGYALPLEGVLDLHAGLDYQFLHGGTRAVKIRVPKEFANNFQFEALQIAERTLVEDVWTITFQKELTGNHTIAITAQIPVAKRREDAVGKSYSFEVSVPTIVPLDAVRTSGIWAVEANTETEIHFETKGVNEMDTLAAPRLANYRPRHRVIGTFGWLGSDYSVTLQGVRHTAAPMPAVLVDSLSIDTLLSTSGLQRHQALIQIRTAGAQYLDATLPGGAFLLSLVVDGTVTKPVAIGSGQVRIPLPARQNSDAPISIVLVYETLNTEWKQSGDLNLTAPKFAKEIPVTSSRWQVWMPDGFEYSAYQSNLASPEIEQPKLLLQSLAGGILNYMPDLLRSRKRAQATRVLEDLRMVDAAVDQYAIEYNRKGSDAVNWNDVRLYLKSGTKLYSSVPNDMFGNTFALNQGRLSTAPMDTLGVTGKISELKERVDRGGETSEEAIARLSIAEDSSQDGTIRSGGAAFDANNQSAGLVRRSARTSTPAAPSPAQAMRFADPKVEIQSKFVEITQNNLKEFSFASLTGNAKREGGLLPVMLDLPKSGNALVFHGLYAADHISLRYHDWWSKARQLWMWFVAGGIIFYFIGRSRPWRRTLWAMLLLSALPLCVSLGATAICNALLGGWFTGLVLNRIAVRCSKPLTHSKEALA